MKFQASKPQWTTTGVQDEFKLRGSTSPLLSSLKTLRRFKNQDHPAEVLKLDILKLSSLGRYYSFRSRERGVEAASLDCFSRYLQDQSHQASRSPPLQHISRLRTSRLFKSPNSTAKTQSRKNPSRHFKPSPAISQTGHSLHPFPFSSYFRLQGIAHICITDLADAVQNSLLKMRRLGHFELQVRC